MVKTFGKKSRDNMIGLHPILIHFAYSVITEFTITYPDLDLTILKNGAVRTLQMQKDLVALKYSKTLKSLHLPQEDGYGHAIDLQILDKRGVPTWNIPDYQRLQTVAIPIARALFNTHNINIQNGSELWGWDYPHYQISNRKIKHPFEENNPYLMKGET